MRFFIFILMWAVCFSGAGYSQAPIWKNQPQRIAVNDNLSYIYQHNPWSEITVIHFLVKGGKAAVPLSKRGIALITNRLAVDLPSTDDLRGLMHLGSTLRSGVYGDYTTYSIWSLSRNLEDTLKVAAKVIKKPLLSGLRISNLKRFMKHREKSEADSPEQLMQLAGLNAFMAGDQPGDKPVYGYGGSGYGSKESRKNIKRKDILAFHKRFFHPSDMVIAVSSDLEQKEITRIMAHYFKWASKKPKSIKNKAPIIPVRIQTKVPAEKKITIAKENQQVLLAMCALLPPAGRENFACITMLENMLGRGIGSKLWPLRSEMDLAYSLNTLLVQSKDAGILYIYIKTEKEKKNRAHKEFKKLLTDFYNTGVSDEELLATQVRSKADFLRSSETKWQRVEKLCYFEALGLGFSFMEDFFSTVDQIDKETINRYMRRVLKPENLLEITIGPTDSQEKEK